MVNHQNIMKYSYDFARGTKLSSIPSPHPTPLPQPANFFHFCFFFIIDHWLLEVGSEIGTFEPLSGSRKSSRVGPKQS